MKILSDFKCPLVDSCRNTSCFIKQVKMGLVIGNNKSEWDIKNRYGRFVLPIIKSSMEDSVVLNCESYKGG